MKFFVKGVVVDYVCNVELLSFSVGGSVIGFYGLLVGEVNVGYSFE